MKMFLLVIAAISMLGTSLNAASIISYSNKKKGEVEFEIFNSNQISLTQYDEDDQKLIVHVLFGDNYSVYKFKVQTAEDALDIVKKLNNSADSSLIELEYY